MKKTEINAIEINPTQPPKYSVIWLHGLGADGYDFVDIATQLNLPKNLAIRFIFPHAPIRPITLNGGYEMRAWFDITALDANAPFDDIGMRESIQILSELVEHEEKQGIAIENIIVAGFSQGAVIALLYGLCSTKKIAGILALSGFLPPVSLFSTEITNANIKTPMLMLHGINDNIIPLAWAEKSKNELLKLNYNISWHTYKMEHSVCLEEIQQVAQWLKNLFHI